MYVLRATYYVLYYILHTTYYARMKWQIAIMVYMALYMVMASEKVQISVRHLYTMPYTMPQLYSSRPTECKMYLSCIVVYVCLHVQTYVYNQIWQKRFYFSGGLSTAGMPCSIPYDMPHASNHAIHHDIPYDMPSCP